MRLRALGAVLALLTLAGCSAEPDREGEEVIEDDEASNDVIEADDTLWLCDPYEEVAECVPAEEVNLP